MLGKVLEAELTLEGLNPGVCGHVLDQRLFLCKSPMASLTFVWHIILGRWRVVLHLHWLGLGFLHERVELLKDVLLVVVVAEHVHGLTHC